MLECAHYWVKTYRDKGGLSIPVRACGRCDMVVVGWHDESAPEPVLNAVARAEIEAILAKAAP